MEKQMTKICKYCQTEIPKKAKICPQCRKKQGGMGKWLTIIIVILMIGSCLGSSDESNSGTNDVVTDQTENNGNVSNSAQNEESNKEDSEKTFISAGESFEAHGLKVTVKEVSTDFIEYDDEYGFYEPGDGTKYIMASFTYENTGSSDAYVSIYDFVCYADGSLCEQTYYFGGDFINANISSGRNVSFETYYIVPINAEEIELEYTSNIWTSEKVIIKIQ